MISSQTYRRSAFAALAAAALLTAAPASAALPGAAVTCRAAIAKSYPKLVSSAAKLIAACHKSREKGVVSLAGVDCNDLLGDPLNVDPKGKYAKAVLKHETTVTSGCVGVDGILIQPDGPDDYYTSCPVTCPGVPNPMTTMTHVGKCLGCEAAAVASEAFTTTLGMPSLPQSKENQKCRGAIGKGYLKYLATYVKAGTVCQGKQDKAVSTPNNNDLTFCSLPTNSDPKGKVALMLSKAEAGLDKACVGADLGTMGSCATDNLANVKSCSLAAWSAAKDEAFTTNYELPATICPSVIRTTIRGGCSVNGEGAGNCSKGAQTGTQLSVGWAGLAHGVDITDSYTLAGNVLSCDGAEKGSCGECIIDGISTDSPQYQAFTRCVDDPWTPCTNAFGMDAVCNNGGGGACRYYLGPPLAISAGGTPTCTLNVINSDISGVSSPDLGTGSLNVSLSSIVHTGISQSRPCPICRNDTTPQDGVKNGSCLGGPMNGQPCDVQGFDLSFAPTNADNPTAGNSLDCPPDSGANISGDGLAIQLPLTTGTSTKTAEDACEPPLGALSCFCGVCSGDNTVSCNTDQDCADLTLGSCGKGSGQGVDRKPNNCSDGYCIPVMGQTDRGLCSGGPEHCLTGPYIDVLCSDNSGCSTCIGGPNDGAFCSGESDCPSVCTGGTNDGTPCLDDTACTGGGTCPDTCLGGSNPGTVCTSDAQCSGTCLGGTNAGAPCFNNTPCTGGGTCQSKGTCAAKCDVHVCGEESDEDKYCTGVLLANGRGVLPCENDASCDSYFINSSNADSWVCPGNDCGTCDVAQFRSCFLDPIEISGTPDTDNPILAGTFCLPPSSNGSVNSATGSPGPGVVKTDAIIELRY
jgi:hypothetical protein